ncbi:MAG: sulfurtransferase [Xanthomonadales bacterium]|nr:sulfurtransferase [Xanthomonadales bacterium]
MPNRILVSPHELMELIDGGECVTVDCRFDLNNTGMGRKAWLEGHVPGAFYAHLDEDLSGRVELHTGRHPLPGIDAFARFLASIGWREGKMLVAYDDSSSVFAVRLWWLMRYFGEPAAILDGGFAAWKNAGMYVDTFPISAPPTPVPELAPSRSMALSTDRIQAGLGSLTLIDARAPERFSGEVEPLDKRAGHIPGSLNRPFGLNLDEDGCFKNPETLRAEFQQLISGSALKNVVHTCGSGVSACHNLFAMELAGLNGTRLYPGSWSRWIINPDRPIELGPPSN